MDAKVVMVVLMQVWSSHTASEERKEEDVTEKAKQAEKDEESRELQRTLDCASRV